MYPRGLLIHGARSVLVNVKEQSAWVEGLARRRPHNVAVVALANKIARTAWAMLSHGQMYQRDHPVQVIIRFERREPSGGCGGR